MIDESLRGPFYGKSLTDIREMIAAEGVVEVARRTLDAIERAQPHLNAFVHVDARDALQQAAAVQNQNPHGRPLYGVPVAVKDLIDVAGWPATSGSRLLADRLAEQDAEVVTRLRAAGAVIIGMTLTHEFAYGPTGDVSKDGPTSNPHDVRRMSGGSSAGSAAAVAAGVVPLALGTDTGGSVRVPAAFCGCFGIKTALGDVPVDGVHPLAPSMDTVGLLSQDDDLAWAGWAVLTGEADPVAVDPDWTWLDIDRVPLVDRRVARLAERVFAQVSAGSTQLVALGNWPEMRGTAGTVLSREAYDVHAHQLDERKVDYQESTWERIDSGRYIGGEQYADARAKQAAWRASLEEFLLDNQVLVCPTVGITAPLILERDMQVDGVGGVSTSIVTNLTVRWNLMGFPALSVPIGELDGLPVGLQLVGKPGSEPALRGAAAQVRQLVSEGVVTAGDDA